MRSKDPGKIARQFEKGDRELDKPSGKGRKVRLCEKRYEEGEREGDKVGER